MAFKKWIAEEETVDIIEEAMNITRHFRDEITKTAGWKRNDAVRAAEVVADAVYQRLLNGTGSLEEYRKTCEQWRNAGIDKEKNS